MSEGDRNRDGTAPYETRDVNAAATWLVTGALGLTIALVVGGLALMAQAFTASVRGALPPATGLQATPLRPPAPNPQAEPYRDIERLLADEAARLNHYAYFEGDRRRARIPIERAMTLTVGRPLDP